MSAPSVYDTIIIGGGPGGSTAGAIHRRMPIVPQLDYSEA